MKTHKSDGHTELPVSNQWSANQVDLEILPDSRKKKKVRAVALWWIKRKKKCQEGRHVWQNDLLQSTARSRGDVIFFRWEGVGMVWRRDEDKFSKWKEEGLTIWPSHHEGGAKRFTVEGNLSEPRMSHPAPDALILVSDPGPVLWHHLPRISSLGFFMSTVKQTLMSPFHWFLHRLVNKTLSSARSETEEKQTEVMKEFVTSVQSNQPRHRRASTWPPNSADLNMNEHPLDKPEQIWFLEDPTRNSQDP